jgi:hypothetical protein
MTYTNEPLKVQDQFQNEIDRYLDQIVDYQKNIEDVQTCRDKLMPVLGNINFPTLYLWDFSVWDGYIGLKFPYDFAVISQIAAQLKEAFCVLKKESGAGKGYLEQEWDVPIFEAPSFRLQITYLPDKPGSSCKKVPIETIQETVTKVLTWDIVCVEAEVSP